MDEYTKRELDAKFEGVHDKLDIIYEQTKSTNGRVRSLEKWRSFIVGGLSVLTGLISISIPIMIALIKIRGG